MKVSPSRVAVSSSCAEKWNRPPCFPNMAAFEKMVVGGSISDAVATLGTLNVIAGELDR